MTTPSPFTPRGTPRSQRTLKQPGQAPEKALQLPLFAVSEAPTEGSPPMPVAPAYDGADSEPGYGSPTNAAAPLQAEVKEGMEWLNEDPFPPPPPFLLPGEHLRKSMEKCIEYIIQHEGLGRSTAFEQFLFLLCAKLFEERNPGTPRCFWADEKEARADEGCAAIRRRIATLFDEVKEAVPSVFGSRDRLTLSDRTIAFVAGELGRHTLSATELDPLGVAYQQWTSATARYDRGQFFTPLGAAFWPWVCSIHRSMSACLTTPAVAELFGRSLRLPRLTTGPQVRRRRFCIAGTEGDTRGRSASAAIMLHADQSLRRRPGFLPRRHRSQTNSTRARSARSHLSHG